MSTGICVVSHTFLNCFNVYLVDSDLGRENKQQVVTVRFGECQANGPWQAGCETAVYNKQFSFIKENLIE